MVYSIDLAETGDDFAQAQKRYPGKLRAIQADTTKESNVTAAVDQIIEECGAIHGMVVNAGRTNHKAALDFTEEEVHALFSINVRLLEIQPASCAPIFRFTRYMMKHFGPTLTRKTMHYSSSAPSFVLGSLLGPL